MLLPELEGSRSGRYGNFFIKIMLSYMDGCNNAAMAFDMSTAIITGTICVICPVISNTITPTDTVWVTAPENAAAPTTAYPPKLILEIIFCTVARIWLNHTRYDWRQSAAISNATGKPKMHTLSY